jgi:hypothetical protein
MKRRACRLLLLLLAASCARVSTGQEGKQVPPEQFDWLHAMFKTQPGESRFWELPWIIQLDQALAKGAAEGKPILVWCGAGGAPVGVC